MPLFQFCLLLAAIGVVLWLFNRYVNFVDAKIKQAINVVVMIVVVILILQAFGVLDLLHSGPKIPHL